MAFCARCGATTQPGATFCGACGAPLAAPSSPPDPAPAQPYAGYAPQPQGPAPQGPVGRVQEPWLPVVLAIVTFGIYALIYWWRVTRETDARTQRPGHAHKLARIGIIVGIVAFVAYFVSLIAMLVGMFSAMDPATGEIPEDAALGFFAFFPVMMLSWLGLLASFILLAVAMWRVWTFIQQEEQRTMRPDPINPALMLVLVLVPFVNIVGYYIALYMTQDRLNRLWQLAANELPATRPA